MTNTYGRMKSRRHRAMSKAMATCRDCAEQATQTESESGVHRRKRFPASIGLIIGHGSLHRDCGSLKNAIRMQLLGMADARYHRKLWNLCFVDWIAEHLDREPDPRCMKRPESVAK